MTNLTTFDNRISIQFVLINSDVTRFDSIFDSNNARRILRVVSLLSSIMIALGAIIEAHEAVMEDGRVIQAVLLGKVFWWVGKSLLGQRL